MNRTERSKAFSRILSAASMAIFMVSASNACFADQYKLAAGDTV